MSKEKVELNINLPDIVQQPVIIELSCGGTIFHVRLQPTGKWWSVSNHFKAGVGTLQYGPEYDTLDEALIATMKSVRFHERARLLRAELHKLIGNDPE